MYHPAGVYAAMPTPFDRHGCMDEIGLRELVADFENTGVNGILVMGTIGEFALMSEQERKNVADIVMGTTDRLEIIMNAGFASTCRSVDLALYLKDLGVDAIIAIEPYFYHPAPDGIIKHYLAIAEAVDMPVMAYNIPQYSGNRLTPDIMDAFKRDGRIIGLKDSEGDPAKLTEFIRRAPGDFSVMVGADALVSYGMCMGAKGMMVGSAAAAPGICVEMYRAAMEGDMKKTFGMQKKLEFIIKAMGIGNFPAAVKYMLTLQGLPGGYVRPPLESLSDTQKKAVEACVRESRAVKEAVR
jgi:4-hydroxy-tetrahydrodipicolinate synthase